MDTISQSDIVICHGNELEPYIHQLGALRIEVFREFPYLYDGNIEYEENYLSTYLNSEESITVLILNNGEVIGASTGLPLSDETEEFKNPFHEKGFDTDTIFYCGESILKKPYRGRGIYSVFMKEREDYARKLGRFNSICFCAVKRPVNHHLKPKNYYPLDEVWKNYGYQKKPELRTTYFWKDINEKEESAKMMEYWMKPL